MQRQRQYIIIIIQRRNIRQIKHGMYPMASQNNNICHFPWFSQGKTLMMKGTFAVEKLMFFFLFKSSIFNIRFFILFGRVGWSLQYSLLMQTFETYQSSDPLMIPIIPPNKSHFSNISSFSSLPQLSKFDRRQCTMLVLVMLVL